MMTACGKRTLYLRRALAVVLCVISAFFFARAAADAVLSPSVPFQPCKTGRAAAGAAYGSQSPGNVTFASVLTRNLMHVALDPPPGLRRKASGAALTPEEQAALAQQVDSLPLSKIGCELLGTVVDTRRTEDCRAMLLMDGRQAAYAPGGEVKGWKIAYIDRRTVVLEKGSRRERLLVGNSRIEAPVPAARKSETSRTNIRRQEVMAQLQDLPGLMRQASFSPATVDGVAGLSVTSIDNRGFFSRIGLQANDLLVRANGQPLTSFEDLAGFSQMLTQDSIELEVVRNGRRTVLGLNIGG